MQSYLQMILLSFLLYMKTQTPANDLNKDLEIPNNQAFQWKMNFYPDPTKQAQKVIFISKTKEIYHPPSGFNNSNVSQSSYKITWVSYLTPN